MPTPNPMTVNHLVGVLCRARKPNIVVEGDDDVIIYRELAKRIGILDVVLLPSGGRNKLLQIYERRGEFSQVPVAFIADQDMWLFSGIEPGYEDVIWTSGYSIENDLYSDAGLERLLDENETAEHQQILDSISTWFAFAVEEYLAGNSPNLDLHCDEMILPGQTELDTGFCTRQGFRTPNPNRVQQIRSAYKLLLRGKQLFQLLVRFLSKPAHGFEKASLNDYALYNFALKIPGSHPLLDRLMEEVKRKIAAHKPTS
ncbi:DUF4435 domain-containing protein [Candidatus Poribacteria bacterium]|nr:DUF4435 domain-containing protein [Candidatus Poribacteria bacterium]